MGNVSKSHFDSEMGKVLKGLKEMTDSVKATNSKVEELSKAQEAYGAQLQEVLGPIHDLRDRVTVLEKKTSAQGRQIMGLRQRQIRVSCTKAVAGENEEAVVAFLEDLFAKHVGYSREKHPGFVLTGPKLRPFKAKQLGAPGSYREAVSGADCWAVVVTVYSENWAFRIRTCKELKGADKVFAVGQELEEIEMEEKAIIQSSPSFKVAAHRYKETTNRWPFWNFATARMGKDVWTVDRVRREDAATGSGGVQA